MLMYVLYTVLVGAGQNPAQPPLGAPAISASESRNYLGIGYRISFYSKVTLLGRAGVQREIKLTEEQKTRIRAVDADFVRKTGEAAREARERLDEYKKLKQDRGELYDRDELRALAQSVDDVRLPLIKQRESLVLQALDRAQRRRLDQIWLQLEGPMAFSRAELQERLNMSPEEIELISIILAQGKAEFLQATELPPDVASANLRRIVDKEARATLSSKDYKAVLESKRSAALAKRKEIVRAIGKILSKQQRDAYDKMLGEPIDLEKVSATEVPGNQPDATKEK